MACMPEDAADWAALTEARLLDGAIALAPEYGWSWRLALRAGGDIGLSKPEVELLLPQGPRDMAALFSYRHDALALNLLGDVELAGLKVRERVARGVQARIDVAMTDEAALRRWMGFLALPTNLALGVQLAWESADRIWRWAGDTATDENHYSKRAILAGLLSTTLAVRVSGTPAAAASHLARGIDAVMNFEKAKARFKASIPGSELAVGAAQAMGKARYGAGSGPIPDEAAVRSAASPTTGPGTAT
jgi:ubiquinone biosynthesis protein COQ9